MEVAAAVVITVAVAVLFFLLFNYITRLRYERKFRRSGRPHDCGYGALDGN